MPIRPGLVIAIGSFGAARRAWGASLTREGGAIKSDVFFEAATAQSGQPFDRKQFEDAHVAFVPLAAFRGPDANTATDHSVCVIREGTDATVLRLHPVERRAEVLSHFVAPPPSEFHGRMFYPISDKEWIAARGGLIGTVSPPGAVDRQKGMIQTLFETDSRAMFQSNFLEFGDYVYVPGKTWVRLNKRTLAAQELGAEVQLQDGGPYRYGTSALLGPLVWNPFGRMSTAPGFSKRSEFWSSAPRDPELAGKAAPIVQRILDYRNRTGLWPLSLEDVSEAGSESRDPSLKFQWNADKPSILGVGTSSGHVYHVFGGDESGWYQDGPRFPEPMKPAGFTAPREFPVPPVERTIAELDHRIRREPDQPFHRRMKASLLYANGQLDPALHACLDWIRTIPASMEARSAVKDVLRKQRSGLDSKPDVDLPQYGPHKTYADWCLYNQYATGGKAAQNYLQAIKLPIAADEAEWYVAEFDLLHAAQTSYAQGRFEQVVVICTTWESAALARAETTDRSYLVLRAAAELRLGRLDEARADVDAAVEAEKSGKLWSGGARKLLDAVTSADRKYSYVPSDLASRHYSWRVAQY